MIIYGKQIFLHILKNRPEILQEVYLTKECDKKIFSDIKKLNVSVQRPDFKKAQALAKGGNHQGFLAKISPLEFVDFKSLKNENFLVMLYGLSDVGNIGAICRSAYALGAGGVIISAVKSINIEGIIRTSSAAALEIPICLASDGLSALNELKQMGFFIYASGANGKDVRKIDKKEKTVLVLGSEGEGIPKKALLKCDETIGIHMARDFDSLNVSAAGAILCDRIING